MEHENEQRAILGGGCITLIIAFVVAAICILISLLDKV